MNCKKVSIFTHTGATYTFLDVVDFKTNESVITFGFTAQSDGNVKRAVFYVKNVVGVTCLEA